MGPASSARVTGILDDARVFNEFLKVGRLVKGLCRGRRVPKSFGDWEANSPRFHMKRREASSP